VQPYEELRFKYLTMAAKVFRPAVPVAHLARVLGFSMARATDATAQEGKKGAGGAEGGEGGVGGVGGVGGAEGDGASAKTPTPTVPRVVLPTPTPEEEAACATWLEEHGATLVDLPSPAPAPGLRPGGGGGTATTTKAMDGKESAPNLFVPEDKNAVAHGDQTLDIEDFLSKTMG
jgi:hypothetical protein